MEPDFMKRGQTSIEFILLFSVILLLFVTAIIPASQEALAGLEDGKTIAQATLTYEKLIDRIQYVSALGNGSQQTDIFFLPKKTKIEKTGNQLTLTFYGKGRNVTAGISGCTPDTTYPEYRFRCTRTTTLPVSFQLTGSMDALAQEQAIELQIRKNNGQLTLNRQR
ncbi:MAG: class III signal peptide-containing protein [Candidatus Diapherotrites archaeon]|nr:class III signal peptide-containing protein [Candidatus Diapherotrites archaeon]